ncbi:MAG: hypothetical protein QXY39_07285 [Thermofilaceae archaeon]
MRLIAAACAAILGVAGLGQIYLPAEVRNPFIAYFDLRSVVHAIRAGTDAWLVPVAPDKPLHIAHLWTLKALGWPEEALAVLWDLYEMRDEAITSLVQLIELTAIDDPWLIARTLLIFKFWDEDQVSLTVPVELWMLVVPIPRG